MVVVMVVVVEVVVGRHAAQGHWPKRATHRVPSPMLKWSWGIVSASARFNFNLFAQPVFFLLHLCHENWRPEWAPRYLVCSDSWQQCYLVLFILNTMITFSTHWVCLNPRAFNGLSIFKPSNQYTKGRHTCFSPLYLIWSHSPHYQINKNKQYVFLLIDKRCYLFCTSRSCKPVCISKWRTSQVLKT